MCQHQESNLDRSGKRPELSSEPANSIELGQAAQNIVHFCIRAAYIHIIMFPLKKALLLDIE